MKIDTWTGCYPSQWRGLIVPEAMSHPAKFSSRLIRRIYEHMLAEGWLKAGDVVIDPFGGVALGAMDAMRLGLRWRGVELEERFVKLGMENIALWQRKFSSMPQWSGDALLLQGDSRQLLSVIEKGAAMRSSPPYAESMGNAEHGGIDWSKQADRKTDHPHGWNGAGYSASVASPPYSDGCAHTGGDTPTSGKHIAGGKINLPGLQGVVSSPAYAEARIGQESGQEHCGKGDQYGATPGQLGAMKANGFEAAISSPPFKGQSADGGWQMLGKYAEEGKLTVKQVKGDKGKAYPSWSKDKDTSYGNTEGQLANMGEGDFQAAVSSPPYENSVNNPQAGGIDWEKAGRPDRLSPSENRHGVQGDTPVFYGRSSGQLGADSGDNFWLAARQIVEQVFLALQPGGHAVWVCKDFVKDKQRQPFCDQWRQLCESVGFVTLHEHHASLVRHHGTSIALNGDRIEHKSESKSFFRRLAEKGAAHKNYWSTLDRKTQASFLWSSHCAMWKDYNQLSPSQKRAKMKDGIGLKYPPPLWGRIRSNALHEAFEKSGHAECDWNKDTRIDYETVYCMVKP